MYLLYLFLDQILILVVDLILYLTPEYIYFIFMDNAVLSLYSYN